MVLCMRWDWLAALFSLVSGFGALFVREGLDPKIRSRAQLKSLSGIEPIVVIPLVRHSGGPSSPTSTLALDVPDSAFAHALRALRGFVLSTVGTSRVVSIGILPCNRGTGASLVAGNLAHLIAAAGRDVTLIDADLRASSLTIQLAPQTQFGLAEMANNTESNPINPQQRLTPNLSFIASRGVNSKLDPNQFIGSRETLLAIAGLTESRDLIVDLASLSVSADAIAIGRSLTGVVVVAALGSTTTDELVELIRTLAASGVRVLGVVLNKASSS